MEFFVKYPITVHVDNVGDIFLSENTLVSQRTKHIDMRHNFIFDYVEDRTVKLILSVYNRISHIHLPII